MTEISGQRIIKTAKIIIQIYSLQLQDAKQENALLKWFVVTLQKQVQVLNYNLEEEILKKEELMKENQSLDEKVSELVQEIQSLKQFSESFDRERFKDENSQNLDFSPQDVQTARNQQNQFRRISKLEFELSSIEEESERQESLSMIEDLNSDESSIKDSTQQQVNNINDLDQNQIQNKIQLSQKNLENSSSTPKEKETPKKSTLSFRSQTTQTEISKSKSQEVQAGNNQTPKSKIPLEQKVKTTQTAPPIRTNQYVQTFAILQDFESKTPEKQLTDLQITRKALDNELQLINLEKIAVQNQQKHNKIQLEIQQQKIRSQNALFTTLVKNLQQQAYSDIQSAKIQNMIINQKIKENNLKFKYIDQFLKIINQKSQEIKQQMVIYLKIQDSEKIRKVLYTANLKYKSKILRYYNQRNYYFYKWKSQGILLDLNPNTKYSSQTTTAGNSGLGSARGQEDLYSYSEVNVQNDYKKQRLSQLENFILEESVIQMPNNSKGSLQRQQYRASQEKNYIKKQSDKSISSTKYFEKEYHYNLPSNFQKNEKFVFQNIPAQISSSQNKYGLQNLKHQQLQVQKQQKQLTILSSPLQLGLFQAFFI